MRTVIVKLPRGRGGSVSQQMGRMRSWLAFNGCSAKFEYDLQPENVVVAVEFYRDQIAEAFKRKFDGAYGDDVVRQRPRLRETMEQVCWWRLTAEEFRNKADELNSKAARETMSQIAVSYDRMAEDLEKRLADPRYREGLIVL
jgi:hypothetical protein